MVQKPVSPPPQSDESEGEVEKQKTRKKKKVDTVKPREMKELLPEEDDENENLMALEIPPLPLNFQDDENPDRLHILKIAVNNFKSYYGSSVIGPFHKDFTSIIGPNGSGKSNVIDSILFVFGYKSSKIRSKKLSSLIHSSQGRVCNSATVQIFFHKIIDLDDGGYAIVPGTEFSVSRTAFKDNTSKYSINGTTTSYKDVEIFLKSKGIDLVHNRFLILQGEVEQIAMMKEKGVNGEEGMLEYLEDIIGTNRYNLPIQKLEKRCDSLSVSQSQQKMRRELAKEDKCALEPDVREAVNYLNKENEAATVKAKLLQCSLLKTTDKIETINEKIKENSAGINELKEKKMTMTTEIQTVETEEKSITKTKETAFDSMEKLKKAIEDIESSEARRKNNIKRCETEVAKIEADLEKEEKKKNQLDSVPEKAQKKIESLKTESEELKEKAEEADRLADENLAEFQSRSAKYADQKKKIEEAYAEKNEALNAVKAKVTVEEAELEDIKKTADKEKNKLEELEKNLSEASDKLSQESVELENVKLKLGNVEERLAKAKKEEHPTIMEEKRLGLEERELRTRLEQEKSSYNKAVSGNKVQEALMKAKAEGKLPGMVGRLGDLGAIEPKYDAAISTNIGALNNYVVETKDDGQAAIEYLKSRNLPRTTFMCMDQYAEVDDRMNRPAGNFPVTRLFDTLTIPDGRLRKMFYHNMGDLLVASNLGEAHQMFKKHGGKFSFVTLNGEKIDNSGALTGGGKPRTGLIGTKVKQPSSDISKKIEELEQKHRLVTEKHSEMVMKMRKISEEIFECDSSAKKLNERKRFLEMSVQSTKQKIGILEQTIQAQRDKVSNEVSFDHTDLENRQKEVENLIRERDEAAEEVGKVKEKLDSITAKVDAIFEELVQVHKETAREAKEKRAVVEKTIAKETVAINNSARNIAKVDEKMAVLNKDLEKKRSELERLLEADAEGEQTVEMKKDIEELQKNITESDKKFAELRKKLNELKETLVTVENELKEETTKIKALTLKSEDLAGKVETIKSEISGISLNFVPTLAFMSAGARPEDMVIEIADEEIKLLTEMPLEALQKISNGLAQKFLDKAIMLETELRDIQENEQDKLDDEGTTQMSVPLLPEEEIRALTAQEVDDLEFILKNLEQQLATSRPKINIRSLEEYKIKTKRYNIETEKYKEIADLYTTHRTRHILFTRLRLEEFLDGFYEMSRTVRELYQSLTLGGDAYLEAAGQSGSEVFKHGVSLIVRPPAKNWRPIGNLSGGEKTLASLALVFALHRYRPTPFYVMDEIDAALDFRNVSIIGHHIKETLMRGTTANGRRAKKAEFIVISLRNNMFEVADRIIGIFKVNDCTRNVQIDPNDICKTQKAICAELGMVARTLPDEVTEDYQREKNVETEAVVGQEREYNEFPSSKDIERAEKVVALENLVGKRIVKITDEERKTSPDMPSSSAAGPGSTEPPSTRPPSAEPGRAQSNLELEPAIRLVAKQSTAADSNDTNGILRGENGKTKNRGEAVDLLAEKRAAKKRKSGDPAREELDEVLTSAEKSRRI